MVSKYPSMPVIITEDITPDNMRMNITLLYIVLNNKCMSLITKSTKILILLLTNSHKLRRLNENFELLISHRM